MYNHLLGTTAGWAVAHYLTTLAVHSSQLLLQTSAHSSMGEVSSRRFAIKILSSLHSLGSFLSGLYVVHELTNGTWTTLGNKASASLGAVVSLEAGFYGFDFLSDVYRVVVVQRQNCKWVDLSFFVHHIVPIVVFPSYSLWRHNKLSKLSTGGANVTTGKSLAFLDYVTALLLVTNVTTVLTNVRWMVTVTRTGDRRSRFQWLDRSVVVLYFVCRVALWPWLVNMYREQQNMWEVSLCSTLFSLPLRCSIGTVTLFSMNLYFWYLNVRKLGAAAPKRA